MKKLSLGKRVMLTTAVIGGLFIGGAMVSQAMSEKTVPVALEEMSEEDIEKAVEEAKETMDKIDNMSLAEFYVDYLGSDPQLLDAFVKKYAVNPQVMKVAELEGEQYNYMNALTYIYNHGEQPILKRNEVDADEKYEYAYSLQTFLADIAAASNEVDTETPIVEICEKYGKDPDGKINELTPEMIMEIDEAIFQASDHPE